MFRFVSYATGLLLMSIGLSHAQQPLPVGLGGINVGTPWDSVQSKFEFVDISSQVSTWDRYMAECGYRVARATTEQGDLLLTTQDFVVTDISLTTSIKPGSDLVAVADLVMQSYGQPDAASMRNSLGNVTIAKDDVSFVVLSYGKPVPVDFVISGSGLWRYQIRVTYPQARWHENRANRCARLKKTQEQPALPPPSDSQTPATAEPSNG